MHAEPAVTDYMYRPSAATRNLTQLNLNITAIRARQVSQTDDLCRNPDPPIQPPTTTRRQVIIYESTKLSVTSARPGISEMYITILYIYNQFIEKL